MPSQFRDVEFQERIHRLHELLARDHACKKSAQVKRHLDEGLNRRLCMIEHSIIVLANLPPNGSAALPLRQVEDANVAVNAIFLNIRGCIDNAAWALLHHLELVDSANEQDWQHRRLATLFGRDFLAALCSRDKELADRLAEIVPWGEALAQLRDPAAHRIPLYIPPSVIDEADLAVVREIDAEMESAAARRDWDTFHKQMDSRWNAGRFRSVVTLSEQEGLAVVPLAAVLNRDLGAMLDALELVVAFVFAEGDHGIVTNCGPLPRRLLPAADPSA